MKLKNRILELSKDELIEIIKNNPDQKSKDVDDKLIKTIYIYYGRFSVKQLSWLTFKVNYILRHSELYKNFRSMKDFILLPENKN